MNKKILIFILTVIIIVIALSVYFVFQESDFPVTDISGFITGFKLDNVDDVRGISEATFKLAQELGVDYVLVPVKLPERDANVDMAKINWSQGLDYYYIFELADKYNVNVLPAFYKLGVENDKDYEKYAEFVISFLDEFYKNGNIKYIEFQNEPVKDYNGKVSARFKGTPTDLAKSHIAAYEKIKAKYPYIQIGTAGFMATAVNASENKMINNYYKEYLSAKPKFDFLALHYYPKTSSYLQTTADSENSKYNFLSEYDIFDTYRKLLNDYGYSDKKIFATEGEIGMPFKNPDGKFVSQWLEDGDVAILLAERFILGISKSDKDNLIGVFTSNSRAPITGIFDYNIKTGAWAKTKQFNFYKKLLEFFKNYPYYSGHIAGQVNSEKYWVEEFKDKNGNKAWIAFAPFLFWAEPETPERLAAVAVKKLINYLQEATLETENVKSVKITSLSEIKTVSAVDGKINFSLGKEPVFIEMN